MCDIKEDDDKRRKVIRDGLFSGPLRSVKQLFVYDIVALQRNTRQEPQDRVVNAAIFVLAYLLCRVAYQANVVKHSFIMAIKLEYDDIISQEQQRLVNRVEFTASSLGPREKYELKSFQPARLLEFPKKLRPAMKRQTSLLSMIPLLQLHTVIPTALESGAELWDVFWQRRMELGVQRVFFLAGRVRSASLRKWAVRYGPLTSLQDVENFKRQFTSPLSDIELTFELNSLPSETYVRNSRLVEQFGLIAFEAWAQALTEETSYVQMLKNTLAIWGLDIFVAKNVLHFIAEGCHAAALKYDFPMYPWVETFFTGMVPEYGVELIEETGFSAALGPNPNLLCNLVAGFNHQDKSLLKGHRKKHTWQAFKDVADLVLKIMPQRIAFRTANGWCSCEVPQQLCTGTWRYYAVLALNMCKVVQVLDAWFTGMIRNPRRGPRAAR